MPLLYAMKKMVDRHYTAMAGDNCNTCNTAAWVVCREQHLLEQSGGFSMRAFFKRLSGSRTKTVTDAPQMTETAACECEKQGCKILIVCKKNTFSPGIADYAINMAMKTRSSLVALSLDESGRNFDQFKDEAQRNIEYFSCKAKDAGLGFCHEIRQGDEDTVVSQMHESDPEFRYVMDDSAVVCKSRSAVPPVYTRATMRAK